MAAPLPQTIGRVSAESPQELRPIGQQKASNGAQSTSNDSSWVKWLVLVFLVLQNCALIMMMRYSRSQHAKVEWSAQTGVIVQEVMKCAFSLTLLLIEGGVAEAFADPMEVLKSGVPAFLYVVQNNMLYVAAAHLDAPSCAVLAQLKVLTTAIFSVTLLKKTLSRAQWVALLILAIGVSCVTVSQMDTKGQKAKSDVSVLPGVLAMLIAGLTSGLAATYFEKILKGSKVSMWARQLQLALFSIAIGGVGLVTGSDWEAVSRHGFFGGYTAAAWITIVVNAVGGMLVAMALKLADAIVKNFSASIAIVMTAVLSAIMMGTQIGLVFALGVLLVIYAVLLYGGVLPPVLRCAACLDEPERKTSAAASAGDEETPGTDSKQGKQMTVFPGLDNDNEEESARLVPTDSPRSSQGGTATTRRSPPASHPRTPPSPSPEREAPASAR